MSALDECEWSATCSGKYFHWRKHSQYLLDYKLGGCKTFIGIMLEIRVPLTPAWA